MATKKAESAIRMEGLTLAVTNVQRSVDFYTKKLGLTVAMNSAPHFAFIRVGTGSIGLLANRHAVPKHDETWERSAQARDPDGYTIEFAQGRRGKNAPR